MSIPYGGWTPSTDWDPCQGGHPGGRYYDETTGLPMCPRCGRLLDLTPCGCPGHGSMTRSYCQTRSRKDKQALRLNRYHAQRLLGLIPGERGPSSTT